MYTYHINLDERGSFYADVRDADENTIYELRADGCELQQVEDGFMRHSRDVDGLADYLVDLSIMPANASLILEN